jgi:uncharacterized iron-regulated protein
MRRIAPVALSLLLSLAPAALADEIAVLPLGEPGRALQLVTGEAGEILDLAGEPKDGSRVRSFDEMVSALATADVVVLGEQHDHAAGHQFQVRLLSALAAARPIALGMEFFEGEDDAALAEYGAGRLSAEELLERTGWYAAGGFHHEAYLPLVDACRRAGAPVFGLNVPRTVIRTVSRQGWDALADEQKAQLGPLGEPDPRHRFVVDLMMGGVGASMGPAFDGMLRGQMAWDAAMAGSILRARQGSARGRLVVALAGMGHCAHGLGIPARLRAADPALRVVVLNPVVAERPPENAMTHPGMEATATATMSRGYAEWAHVLPDEEGRQEFPAFGMTLEVPEGAKLPSIKSVETGAPADLAGLRAGDVLTEISGRPAPATVGAARFALSPARWGDRVVLGVQRDGRRLDVPVLLVPPADGPGRPLTSRRASFVLDAFDPASSRPVEAAPAPGLPQARLIEARGKPVRLDILEAGRLAQSWTLDAGARPVAGVLAEPASDGAVRVEIERDAAGSATAVRRLDAAGRPIASP